MNLPKEYDYRDLKAAPPEARAAYYKHLDEQRLQDVMNEERSVRKELMFRIQQHGLSISSILKGQGRLHDDCAKCDELRDLLSGLSALGSRMKTLRVRLGIIPEIQCPHCEKTFKSAKGMRCHKNKKHTSR